MESFKDVAFLLVGFALVSGIISLAAPESFLPFINPLRELVLIIILLTSFLRPFNFNNFKKYDFKVNVQKNSVDFFETAVEENLKAAVLEKLSSEGINPHNIRIDINVSEKEVAVKGCILSLYENEKDNFQNCRSNFESYFGFPFYEEEEI